MTFEGEAKNKQKKLRIVRKLMIGRHIYIYIYIYIYMFSATTKLRKSQEVSSSWRWVGVTFGHFEILVYLGLNFQIVLLKTKLY